jgi:hypothetical protein
LFVAWRATSRMSSTCWAGVKCARTFSTTRSGRRPGVQTIASTNASALFTAAQQVELILDVARHATNKFAVSMAVDTPHVDDGFEVYLVAADGSTTYGLERP